MGYLFILLLSLLAGLSGCAAVSETSQGQVKTNLDTSGVFEKSSNNTAQAVEETMGEGAMKEMIESYVQGADEQQVELVDQAFHQDFQVFAHSEGSIRVLNKATYLALLSAGKIGGTKRQIKYIDLQMDGPIGTARIELVGEKVTFRDHLSLIQDGETWKIVSNVTQVIPNP